MLRYPALHRAQQTAPHAVERGRQGRYLIPPALGEFRRVGASRAHFHRQGGHAADRPDDHIVQQQIQQQQGEGENYRHPAHQSQKLPVLALQRDLHWDRNDLRTLHRAEFPAEAVLRSCTDRSWQRARPAAWNGKPGTRDR